MAKYSDYVKEPIENEIDEAAQQQQARQENVSDGFEMPKEFVGKSPAEIAKSYVELQKLNSRQAQDLGSMRKSVDELVNLQSQAPAPTEVVQDDPVDIDALYSDTEGAISRVARKAVGSEVEELRKELANARAEARLSQFDTQHPNWREVAESPEFLNWVQESPYRVRLAQAADTYDFDAAEDLFSAYDDFNGRRSNERQEQTREQQLRDASLETSAPGVLDVEDTFSRTDLTNARIAAKKGDRNARTWLSTNADAIALAYEDGRITD